MIEFPALTDKRIRERMEDILRTQFTGRIMAVYENGEVLRVEFEDHARKDHGYPREAVTDADVRRRVSLLPRNFYGRITVYFHAGIPSDLVISESLKPKIDRERTSFAK